MSAKRAEYATKTDVNLNKFLDEIKSTAYDIYQERMKNHASGDEMQDWLKAEIKIKKKYNI